MQEPIYYYTKRRKQIQYLRFFFKKFRKLKFSFIDLGKKIKAKYKFKEIFTVIIALGSLHCLMVGGFTASFLVSLGIGRKSVSSRAARVED